MGYVAMSNASALLAFTSAFFGVALAVAVVANRRRSLVHFFFAAGMLALAAESTFNGLSFKATTVEEIVYWQHWRLLATSFLPGIWLFFSLSYSRGNHQEFLQRWRLALVAFFFAPLVLGIFFNGELIIPQEPPKTGIDLDLFGFALSQIGRAHV